MHIPSWWKKELKIIDPALSVVWNEHLRYFEVWKTLEYKPLNSRRMVKEPVLRACFDRLNDAGLTNLRHRQWIGRHIMRGSAENYIKWIKDEEKAEKAKEIDRSRDMMAHGFMEMFSTKHTVS
jgi:hypothetical protein